VSLLIPPKKVLRDDEREQCQIDDDPKDPTDAFRCSVFAMKPAKSENENDRFPGVTRNVEY
jgi:hypothetical protein